MIGTRVRKNGRVSRGAAVAALVVLVTLIADPAAARGRRPGHGFGLGIILGEPSGLTAKYWLHPNHALDLHLSYDLTDNAFALMIDYLFHFELVSQLNLYVGVGGKMVVDDGVRRSKRDSEREYPVRPGVRFPIGLAYLFAAVPIELFLEIAPGIRLLPNTSADVDGGIGFRYYF